MDRIEAVGGPAGSAVQPSEVAFTDRLPWRTALFVFLSCTFVYFATRSPALDEWDSVQFALGAGEFNLWKHQPHPPGYPLYIALGWLAQRLFGLDVVTALALVSALGGGLFVACWFALLARRFEAPVVWLSVISTAGLLVTWMTATKVLTDSLGAGLLALQLFAAQAYRHSERQSLGPLALVGLAGAFAAGARPQNFAVILLILILTLTTGRSSPKIWSFGIGIFVLGCLAWLVPTMWLQAQTSAANGDWLAYPHQLWNQWLWRLEKPKVFLGATGQTTEILLAQLDRHFVGWLKRGFGFGPNLISGWLGIGVLAIGWALHFVDRRRAHSDGTAAAFWRHNLPWAVAYVAVIFCCLPGDQRYYLPIFPLLVLPAVAGWWSLPGFWRWSAGIVPLAVLVASLPYVPTNHKDEAPPVRLIRFLQRQHPPTERPDVWLVLRDARRHAEWYAGDFHLVRAENWDATRWPDGWEDARTIYTDDLLLAAAPSPPETTWQLSGRFYRSSLIYRKHNEAMLYRLQRNPAVTP